MSKWEEVKLGDIAKTQSGGTPSRSKKQYWSGDIPWLKSGELEDSFNVINNTEFITELGLKESSAKLFSKGTLLLAMYGATAGKLGILGIDACTNQAVCSIQNNKNLFDEKFVYFFLLLKREQIIKDSFGGAQPNISKTYIDNIKVPLPPLPVQKQIVAKLDASFERIDKSIALLEENIKHTQDLMASVLDEEFSKLGERYDKYPLLKHVDFIGGSQPPKSSFSDVKKEGYVRLIQIRDYKSDNHIVYIKENSTKKFCKKDDIMIGRYGPPVFQILRGLEGAYNVALMKAIPNEKLITKDFLFYFLQNGSIQNYIISISQRSAGQSGVNKKALEEYEIAIPPLDIQERTVEKIKTLIENINVLKEQQNKKLEHLKSLKSSLLDMAFKGELVK